MRHVAGRRARVRLLSGCAAVLTCLPVATTSLSAGASGASGTTDGAIVAGKARFEVLTPTLVRLEYSPDGHFEDRPTLNVTNRDFDPPLFSVKRAAGTLRITTSRMSLAYEIGSGRFRRDNLTVKVRVAGRTATGHPVFRRPTEYQRPPSLKPTATPAYVEDDPGYQVPRRGNLGGWYRALDGSPGPVRLHDGLLSRRGWYLLDDSQTVLPRAGGRGFEPRPVTDGSYQDGYLFGYGHDYRRGLKDLSELVGRSPLLPRNAFGVWWSKYNPDPQSSYGPLVRRFERARVNLGVVNVDTDAKAPHVWNGWSWSHRLFPDPGGFVRWAHRRGLHVGFNIHPSVSVDDPKFLEANERAGGVGPVGGLREDPVRCRGIVGGTDLGLTGLTDLPPSGETTGAGTADCRVFDLARAGDQDAYLRLHDDFVGAGVDLFWLDYCCDESDAVDAGASDSWMNHLYARWSRARGSRWPVLSRAGGSLFDVDTETPGIWSERRNTVHFTGDTQSTWDMLDFETAFTAAEGNVGLPYVSHDIGGFLGDHLRDDLYVRWVQAGTFQPILRLHSNHGDRLPWEYSPRARRIAERFLRLRGELVPYLYTLAHQARVEGLPMVRSMFLGWPEREAAYRHPGQFMLGDDLLVAPVAEPGRVAAKTVWFPPGAWTDLFTGRRHVGPAVERLRVPLGRAPVFARGGSVLPRQRFQPHGLLRTPRSLVLGVTAGRAGRFTMYEDSGDGLAYERGRFASTTFRQRRSGDEIVLAIGASHGQYRGEPASRRYELRVDRPGRIGSVTVGGEALARTRPGAPTGWWYDGRNRTVVVRTDALPTHRASVIRLR
ncbi:MAG TPA: TIM-barrel domain-containing protein [Nocardioidaceae bacterium]